MVCRVNAHNSTRKMIPIFFAGIILSLILVPQKVTGTSTLLDLDMFQNPPDDPCINSSLAVKCIPPFENIAFGKEVVASSTCGAPPSRHCLPRKSENELTNCFICDSRRQYPASYLTDLNNQQNESCWVSQLGIDSPRNVTLTLSLGKKFELTYVSLQFCSAIADSMIFYKSTNYGKSWIPLQYYSSDCLKTYRKDPNAVISKANEQEAVCSEDYSKTRSRKGTRVAFSTLQDRPSSYHFEESPVLQDWVTATDIKIVFEKMAVPDRRLLDDDVRDQMFYGVSDFAVGGRCKCNGHASKCITSDGGKLVCDCKHNTEGAECEKCKPFHLDRPWARASSTDAHECVGKWNY